MNWKIIVAIGLIAATASQALALQQGGAPPAPTGPAPGTVNGADAARYNRDQQEGYNRVVNQGVKVTNPNEGGPTGVKKKGGTAAAVASDLTVGAAVRDKNGVQIATIESVAADGVVVKSGDRLAKLPLNAFGKDDGGLLIGITGAEFQAAIAATSVAVPKESKVVAATAGDMTPGSVVRDVDGVTIGTVDKLVATGVVLLTDGKKVKLELNSFGKDDKGLLIGITASEFKAIINKPKPASTGS